MTVTTPTKLDPLDFMAAVTTARGIAPVRVSFSAMTVQDAIETVERLMNVKSIEDLHSVEILQVVGKDKYIPRVTRQSSVPAKPVPATPLPAPTVSTAAIPEMRVAYPRYTVKEA